MFHPYLICQKWMKNLFRVIKVAIGKTQLNLKIYIRPTQLVSTLCLGLKAKLNPFQLKNQVNLLGWTLTTGWVFSLCLPLLPQSILWYSIYHAFCSLWNWPLTNLITPELHIAMGYHIIATANKKEAFAIFLSLFKDIFFKHYDFWPFLHLEFQICMQFLYNNKPFTKPEYKVWTLAVIFYMTHT